jgi:inosine-uridine nucleoside N-ribohydrolase
MPMKLLLLAMALQQQRQQQQLVGVTAWAGSARAEETAPLLLQALLPRLALH